MTTFVLFCPDIGALSANFITQPAAEIRVFSIKSGIPHLGRSKQGERVYSGIFPFEACNSGYQTLK
jgi:hypothetical protein